MSDYETYPNREVNPYDVTWQPLVSAAEAGVQQSPEDARALQIREACLQLADYFEAVGEGMVDTDDPVAHASLLVQCYQDYDILQHFSIQTDIQIGRPEDDYRDPSVMAEYMAGQWMNKAQLPAQAVSGEDSTSNAEEWLGVRRMVMATRLFLAADLGRPHLPPIQDTDDQASTN